MECIDIISVVSMSKIREKRLSPRRAPRRSLLPLSPKRTQVRLKSILYLVWLAPDSLRTHGRPRGKSALCGLNGLLPRLAHSRGTFHLNPLAALLRFAFGQKIWHTIFFCSKTNFKIFLKLLPKPRGASQSPKSWRVTAHPRYLAWSICDWWLEKIPLRTRCCGISVLLRRCLAPRLKNCVNSFQKGKQRQSGQLSRYPMWSTPNMLFQLP